MNPAHKRLGESALIKLSIALTGDQFRDPNIPQARAILDELERQLMDSQSLESVGLDSQTINYLEREGITTADQLRRLEAWEMLAIRGMTAARVADTIQRLEETKTK